MRGHVCGLRPQVPGGLPPCRARRARFARDFSRRPPRGGACAGALGVGPTWPAGDRPGPEETASPRPLPRTVSGPRRGHASSAAGHGHWRAPRHQHPPQASTLPHSQHPTRRSKATRARSSEASRLAAPPSAGSSDSCLMTTRWCARRHVGRPVNPRPASFPDSTRDSAPSPGWAPPCELLSPCDLQA